MFPVNIIHAQLPFSSIFGNNVAILFVGGACAFLLAYLLTFGVIAVCRKTGWLDQPSERRVHTWPVPRLGGVGMFLAFVLASLIFYITDPELQAKEIIIYWLLLISATLIVLVHAYDDVRGLKPLPKLIAQTVAVIILLGPFDGMFHGVLLFGFSDPFSTQPSVISLFIDTTAFSWLAIPAVLFTWFWMVGMMNTVNWIDGMDGLATGVVAITALFITIISWILKQHTIAILSAIFTGAVLGFLPHNWNPARVFMGDSGSQFLGLTLAVLSIMGGAKVALVLMVLGIPVLDVALVIINRIRRGQSPLHYDKTHLHHRLMATGLSVRQICYVVYGLMITFGLLALAWRGIYKLVGIGLVGLAMAALIIWMDYRQRQRGVPIKLDGPGPNDSTDDSPIVSGQKKSEVAEATSQQRDSAGGSLPAQSPL